MYRDIAGPTDHAVFLSLRNRAAAFISYRYCRVYFVIHYEGWLGSRVVIVLDSGAEGPRYKSQPRRCRVTVLGKLLTLTVPLFTKQQNW